MVPKQIKCGRIDAEILNTTIDADLTFKYS